jgi:hypothetical protein
LELKNRNWKNSRIARELGMDEDEILRLCQITGLEYLFKDEEFSKSWNVEDSDADGFEELTDDPDRDMRDAHNFRSVNTSDPERIFHTHDKWECYKAGFYNTTMKGMTESECHNAYAEFLSDLPRFEEALIYVINNWKHSCEHYLTNKSMNRIAWLGQASACHALGIPSKYCGGYNLMTEKQKDLADKLALKYLNKWLEMHDYNQTTLDDAIMAGKITNIY